MLNKNQGERISGDGAEALVDLANKAGCSVRNAYNHTSEELRNAVDKMNVHVREKPIQTSMIALAAGVVLGMLFRRK